MSAVLKSGEVCPSSSQYTRNYATTPPNLTAKYVTAVPCLRCIWSVVSYHEMDACADVKALSPLLFSMKWTSWVLWVEQWHLCWYCAAVVKLCFPLGPNTTQLKSGNDDKSKQGAESASNVLLTYLFTVTSASSCGLCSSTIMPV